jgi:hypothetical protein
MTENKNAAGKKTGEGKGADERKATDSERQAPEGQVNQESVVDTLDPQIDPTAQPREQVPVMVDPERPYVDGQDDPFAELREPGTGQIPAKAVDENERGK